MLKRTLSDANRTNKRVRLINHAYDTPTRGVKRDCEDTHEESSKKCRRELRGIKRSGAVLMNPTKRIKIVHVFQRKVMQGCRPVQYSTILHGNMGGSASFIAITA